ncbi:rubredoxin [Denitromonas iodatirespirans]|uniref:Rubredoxin n=1 Tax=Denitromonas iodatirespirans TaxID=2795389 RepID=A0A944DEX6_DENI1|nr:rubredoxin [Denitromonas iodatirespirans]MBT0963831.1 rubredoxin [Denitromonas iodatirespirans]
MAKYQCSACYFPYDEDTGLPDEAIAPGTLWADIPDDWICPECGTPKAGFIGYHPEG